MQLRPYQNNLLRDIFASWQSGNQNVLAVLPTGAGKCLAKGTPVVMFDGRVLPVEQIKPGDFLMGPDSNFRLVMSTCNGEEMLYKVTPIKGEPYVVNESHILSLRLSNFNYRIKAGDGQYYTGGSIVNISVSDYLKSSKTFKHLAKGWKVAVDFPPVKNNSIISPYILGVWLGDGNSRLPEICNVDHEVLQEWENFASEIGLIHSEKRSDSRVTTYSINSGIGSHKNPLLEELRRLNLILNKHIPLEFKTDSIEKRLELLAGIIDTDGYLTHNNYDIVVKQKQFAEDITFLVRSLGLAAYCAKCKKTCTNTGVSGFYYRISISGDTDKIPCRVKRRIAAPRKQKKDVLVTGIKVEPIGFGEYFGFELVGRDRLFLLGDFTVTHNTVCFSEAIRVHNGGSCAIAHRQELVSQISLALAKDEVRHRIIGPTPLIKWIVQLHIQELGRDFYDPSARCAVAGVDTLIRRQDDLQRWAQQVTLWVQDEAHHVLRDNKWGTAVGMFPNARGLGVTATPERADGKGLGRTADGVFDHMLVGPGMRDLIGMDYLTDYRVFCPPSDLDLTEVATGADGDYIRGQLALKTRRSSVMGDVVDHYQRIATGKLGVTFAPDVMTATELSVRFNQAGVPAEVVSAKTPDRTRQEILRRFRRRELLQLVNVDLFGEGFDLPAIEVVSMARATQSYGLYVQQFGRACRLMEGKDRALIIDHVGNVVRHGLPDRPRIWSLERREKRVAKQPAEDVIPLRTCLNPACMAPYERVLTACPFCGSEPIPASRTAPEFVDGDLCELDEATLAAMRGEVAKVDRHPDQVLRGMQHAGHPYMVAKAAANRHGERMDAQTALRQAMALWAGYQRALGRSDREGYRRFYHGFGVDVMTAQALGRAEAEILTAAVCESIMRLDAEWRAACG